MKTREAVGVFHDVEALSQTADRLMEAGFDRADLHILAGHHAIEEKLGHMYKSVGELEDDSQIPKAPYKAGDSALIGKSALIGVLTYLPAAAAAGMIVATGGTLAVAIAGLVAAGAVGGGLGAVLARLMGRDSAQSIADQLERGGVLLWVRTVDTSAEERAITILRAAGATDVHIHDLPEMEPNPKLRGEIYGYLNWLEGEAKPQHPAGRWVEGA